MTENKLIKDITSNAEFKKKFIDGLNKLGFPLEFKIRQKLMARGYNSVQEGFFTAIENGQEITKSFDISCYKDSKKIILKDLTIDLSMQFVGDCKYSSDENRFLFAIPDTSNPANKLFIGPLLTSFQSANYGVYRNSEVVSLFLSKFGNVFISSDIKDTSKDHITNGKEDKDGKIPDYEKIFNIVENTILPAVKEKFIRWRSFAYQDYARELSDLKRDMPLQDFISLQEKRYYSGKLIVPIIITSKPIIKPVISEKNEIIDVEEIKFTLYEHSVLKPNNYLEILGQCYDMGVFVCNEKYFEDFLVYIENLFSKTFEEITNNLSRHPFRLIDDFEEIQKHDDEIQQIKGTSILLPFRKKQN